LNENEPAYCEFCGTPKSAPNYAYHICAKPTVKDADVEAVKRLQIYFMRDESLVSRYGTGDKAFTDWIKNVMRVIHIEDMKRVKARFEMLEPIYTCPTCGARHEDGGRRRPPVYCDECGADWKDATS